jgi:hypothetical protein
MSDERRQQHGCDDSVRFVKDRVEDGTNQTDWQIGNNFEMSLASVDLTLTSGRGTLGNANATLASATTMLNAANGMVEPSSEQIDQTLQELRRTLAIRASSHGLSRTISQGADSRQARRTAMTYQ